MSLRSISFHGVAGGREAHHLVTFEDGLFVRRELGQGPGQPSSASYLVQRILEPFTAPGPAHLVIIDHDPSFLDVGFVARREPSGWVEATSPDESVPITWQDVDAECWAALERLLEASLGPSPEDPGEPDESDGEERAGAES